MTRARALARAISAAVADAAPRLTLTLNHGWAQVQMAPSPASAPPDVDGSLRWSSTPWLREPAQARASVKRT